MTQAAPYTPKEFASDVLGGKRSAKWVRRECRLYRKTKGKAGIPVISTDGPYLIPPSAAARFAVAAFARVA